MPEPSKATPAIDVSPVEVARALQRATDPADLRTAWVAIRAAWAASYDRVARIVGLRPAGPSSAQAYQLRPAAGVGHGPYVVSAIAFTKFYEISTDQSLRWTAHMVDGVLCVELDSSSTPVTSNRAAERSSGPRTAR